MSWALHTALNTSATSLDVANADLHQPMLATSAIGSGYAIAVGGEQMQVSAVAASLVTYGAVGIALHANNASVQPGLPDSLAQGNLMIMFACIRNSGAGVPDTISGWTRLAVFPANANAQVFAKVAGASESAPTQTFSGGVANACTSAQIIRLAGLWHSAANVLIGAASRLNPSAQNIIYPGVPKPVCDNAIALWFGWKADDWTTTTPPGTKIADPSTQQGDDQGITWSYSIQTAATGLAAAAITVTDGGAAISRCAVAVIRCDYQSVTVTRSANGVIASHSAGDDVSMPRPTRWGLL